MALPTSDIITRFLPCSIKSRSFFSKEDVVADYAQQSEWKDRLRRAGDNPPLRVASYVMFNFKNEFSVAISVELYIFDTIK